ncbi:MAG: NUDIX hydrolase [Candidatus Poseidoniales archaeon]
MSSLMCDLGVAARVIMDGRILLVQEAKGPFEGKWGLPKGHVHSGETPEKAVLRELMEETGYSGQVLGLAGLRTTHRREQNAIFLTFDVAIGQEQFGYDDSEIREIRWCSLSDVKSMDFISETMYQLVLHGLLKKQSTIPFRIPLSRRGEDYHVYSSDHVLQLAKEVKM